jgi:hypothetical protein
MQMCELGFQPFSAPYSPLRKGVVVLGGPAEDMICQYPFFIIIIIIFYGALRSASVVG